MRKGLELATVCWLGRRSKSFFPPCYSVTQHSNELRVLRLLPSNLHEMSSMTMLQNIVRTFYVASLQHLIAFPV